MKLNEIEAFWAKFCDKCRHDLMDNCDMCYVTDFLIATQVEWQLQELRDMGADIK